MPNPTDSIFLPYHALDNVIVRGTRAGQPAATAVTPGTLYCVSNEGNKIERSSGSVWEAFSPTADVPANVALKDQANVFTADQTLSAVQPRLILNETDQPANQRRFDITLNGQNVAIQSRNDDGSGAVNSLVIARNGDVTASTNLSVLGSAGNVACKDQANIFTIGQQISSINPSITFTETDRAANLKAWLLYIETELFRLTTMTDAGTGIVGVLTIDRSGNLTSYGYLKGGGAIIERNRTVAMGDWTAFTPTVVGGTVTESANCRYTIIGSTVIMNVWFTVTIPATGYIQMVWPTSAGYTNVSESIEAGFTGPSNGYGMALTQNGYNSFFIYSNTAGGGWPAGSFTVRFVAPMSVYGI